MTEPTLRAVPNAVAAATLPLLPIVSAPAPVSPNLVLAIVCVGIVLANLDLFIVNVALSNTPAPTGSCAPGPSAFLCFKNGRQPAREANTYTCSSVCGRAVHATCRQSIPSTSIDSCTAVSDSVPSLACGQTKWPFSSRFEYSTSPWPSQ